MATEGRSEKGVGSTIVLTLLALGGGVFMYAGAGDPLSGWGFAAAMLAGSLAVVAAHRW